jgi:DNA recombination protein RmuC
MTALSIALAAVSIVVSVMLLVAVLGMLRKPKTPPTDPGLTLMQQQLESLRTQVASSLATSAAQMTQQMSEVTKQVGQQLGNITQQVQGTTEGVSKRLDTAAEVIRGVQRSLGELSGSTQRILDVGKDIAQLQQILQAPKLRGGLGELFLGDLISQILPQEHFELQHRFKSGEVVDAIIRLGKGIVPVDAKFPLENFRRLQAAQSDDERTALRKQFAKDVKKHADDIARKYILPDEGTFDFALMYIPAENVYYETIIKDDATESEAISAYALKKKVIPVSPNSFYAYLQAITVGLRGLQIEKQAREIMNLLQTLNNDFVRFRDDFELVGKHLANAHSKYDDSTKRLVRFEDKLTGAAQPAVPAKAESLPPPE